MAEEQTERILDIKVNYADAVNAIVDYKNKIEECGEAEKDLTQQFKNGTISEEEYKKAMVASKQVTTDYKNTVRELEKQIGNGIKQQKNNQGSLKSLRAELSNVTKAYDELSREERQSAKGQDMLKHLNDVTTELKDAEYESQRFYRNVGNYPDAVKPLKAQLKELTQVLAQMKLEGKDNTQEFQDMMQKAGELKDTMADTSQQIGVAASDTGKLDSAQQGLTGLLATYQMWNMATQSLGLQNKELEDVMKGLMATLALVNAATTIANALQSQSALMKGVTAIKTWVLNTALGAQTVATTASATAEAGATTATWAWNAALYANPLMWLVAIIAVAVAAVYGLIKAFQWMTASSEQQKEAYEAQGEALERLKKQWEQYYEYLKAIGKQEADIVALQLRNIQELIRVETERVAKSRELYGDDSDEFKKACEDKKKSMEDYSTAIHDAYNSIAKKIAQFHASEEEAAMGSHKYKIKLMEEERDANIRLIVQMMRNNQIARDDAIKMIQDLRAAFNFDVKNLDKKETKTSSSGGSSTSTTDTAKARRDKEREETRKAEDELTKIIQDAQEKRRTEVEQQYNREIEDLRRKLAEEKNLTAKAREAINVQITAKQKQLNIELEKISIEATEKEITRVTLYWNNIINAAKKGGEDEYQLKLGKLAQDYELEKANYEKQYADAVSYKEMLHSLDVLYNKKIEDLQSEHNKIIIEAQAKAMQDEWNLKTAQAQGSDFQNGDNGTAELELKVQQKQYELDTLHQLEDESETAFSARKLQIQNDYNKASKDLSDKRVAIQKAETDAIMGAISSLSDAMTSLGETDKNLAKASKIVALAEIAVSTGVAIANGIKEASAAQPWYMIPVAIASTVATVLANIATATKTVKSAKFATGGYVSGSGTATSDSIPAMLSNGESVITANATSMFTPLLSALNTAGGGNPINIVNNNAQAMGEDMLARAVARGVAQMPNPVVSVKEITDVNTRVKVLEDLSNI